jgi:hypothetical protein
MSVLLKEALTYVQSNQNVAEATDSLISNLNSHIWPVVTSWTEVLDLTTNL